MPLAASSGVLPRSGSIDFTQNLSAGNEDAKLSRQKGTMRVQVTALCRNATVYKAFSRFDLQALPWRAI
jgi:hypothetical protein